MTKQMRCHKKNMCPSVITTLSSLKVWRGGGIVMGHHNLYKLNSTYKWYNSSRPTVTLLAKNIIFQSCNNLCNIALFVPKQSRLKAWKGKAPGICISQRKTVKYNQLFMYDQENTYNNLQVQVVLCFRNDILFYCLLDTHNFS